MSFCFHTIDDFTIYIYCVGGGHLTLSPQQVDKGFDKMHMWIESITSTMPTRIQYKVVDYQSMFYTKIEQWKQFLLVKWNTLRYKIWKPKALHVLRIKTQAHGLYYYSSQCAPKPLTANFIILHLQAKIQTTPYFIYVDLPLNPLQNLCIGQVMGLISV